MEVRNNSVCSDYVGLFSMNANLRMFCILCLCLIRFDTRKASENLTFKPGVILSSVFVVMIICRLGAMNMKESVEQMTFDLFQNIDVHDGVSVSFDPEVVLNDNAVGRFR